METRGRFERESPLVLLPAHFRSSLDGRTGRSARARRRDLRLVLARHASSLAATSRKARHFAPDGARESMRTRPTHFRLLAGNPQPSQARPPGFGSGALEAEGDAGDRRLGTPPNPHTRQTPLQSSRQTTPYHKRNRREPATIPPAKIRKHSAAEAAAPRLHARQRPEPGNSKSL